MYVVAGSKRLAAKEDTRPVFKLIASHCKYGPRQSAPTKAQPRSPGKEKRKRQSKLCLSRSNYRPNPLGSGVPGPHPTPARAVGGDPGWAKA
ncbi:Uncharacterized protein HZ326_11259 [Fusarium oxysporum f. sp. albedinis]|nr:Uncharacterized protein HZ326_11259 [Fusarium oxysporum f. sp. albedinis]